MADQGANLDKGQEENPNFVEVAAKAVLRVPDATHPLAITDALKNSHSENTSRKVWAAKYAARDSARLQKALAARASDEFRRHTGSIRLRAR